MDTLQKKVALVSGGNRGIGLEICRQLSRRGILVFMGVRRIEAGHRAQQELATQGLHVQPVRLEVTDLASLSSAVESIRNACHRLDILVNNAGILIDGQAEVLTLDEVILHQTMETNFLGALRLCQICIPLMRENGYGRIVNMSSSLGSLNGMTDSKSASDSVLAPAYRMSKTALNVLTVLIAKELRGTNILINSACPGWVKTRLGGIHAPRSVEEGADTPVWLATLPDKGPTGGFYNSRSPFPW
ncbi:MAG: SDR family oxidoreductase [Desulfatirhabdiaceae bacterium]